MTTLTIVLLAVWLLSAAATVILMGRWGYDPWSWGFLGLLYGILSIPFAVLWHRRNRHRHEEHLVDLGHPRPGTVSVLVGVDGSAEAFATVSVVAKLLGRRLRSLTLATVVDFDAADSMRHPGGLVFQRDAEALLHEAGELAAFAHPTTVILVGRPADALTDYAARHDIDVIAVGARGRGAAKTVLGSVAEQLVRHPNTLVLIAGRRTDDVSVSVAMRHKIERVL